MDERWDIQFTPWKDFEVTRGNNALVQRFVLMAEARVGPLVGNNIDATNLSRFRRRLIQDFLAETSVEDAYLDEFNYDGDTLDFELVIEGERFSDEVTL